AAALVAHAGEGTARHVLQPAVGVAVAVNGGVPDVDLLRARRGVAAVQEAVGAIRSAVRREIARAVDLRAVEIDVARDVGEALAAGAVQAHARAGDLDLRGASAARGSPGREVEELLD